MTTAVWRCEPRSHERNKAASPLPGRPPSVAVPHRSASPALCLCPCGHEASFRRRASSFVRGLRKAGSACLFSCKQGAASRRERRARAPPVPVLELPLMSPQTAVAVAAAESPLCLAHAHGAVGAPRGAATRGAAAVLAWRCR